VPDHVSRQAWTDRTAMEMYISLTFFLFAEAIQASWSLRILVAQALYVNSCRPAFMSFAACTFYSNRSTTVA
jgi:hypothetical protein